MGEPTTPRGHWSEDDSRAFLANGRFFVPGRDEQERVFCDLIPASRETFHVDELGCGEGLLSRAILERHPRARVRAFDASAAMIQAATSTNARFADRFSATTATLQDYVPDRQDPPRVVVSSLVVHHLGAEGKRELFGRVARGLAPGGCLLLADLVEPATDAARRLAAASWDEEVERTAAAAGIPTAVAAFREEGWNHFALSEPDPLDVPSPLFDQLRWLSEAGFGAVDVFWMRAGHAVFGGFMA